MLPAVALVPGFFGFDHRESQTYFADRFIAGLRASLEARGHVGVPVIAVSTLGIAGLWQRQADLLEELRALETPDKGGPRLGGPRVWHLVGHSTGGVDAAMLLRARPLLEGDQGSVYSGESWGRWTSLVERIASVTTISAPHFGTALADSPLARLSNGHPSLAAVRDVCLATLDLARRGDLDSRISFALSAMPSVTQTPIFLLRMALRNQLVRDLRPAAMAELTRVPLREGMDGRVFSVATVTPRPGDGHSDKLFRELWTWTHRAASVAPPLPPSRYAALDALDLRLPSQRSMSLPSIDPGDSDGIVSTSRQVLGEPIALVVGDHVDVLGRYQRVSLVDGKVIDPGLLTSGASFGDDEFFQLIDRLGDRLARSLSAAR